MTTRSAEISYQHGGNIYHFAQMLNCDTNEIIDFSSNINPHQATSFNQFDPTLLTPYSDPDYRKLKQAIKQRYPALALKTIAIEPVNGASAAIFSLFRFLQPAHCVFYAPLYKEYHRVAALFGGDITRINRIEKLKCVKYEPVKIPVIPHSTIVFVNPATPDGYCYEIEKYLESWIAAKCTIIIDESFLDFTKGTSVATHIGNYERIFLIKSLTKFYGCAGVRIGFIAGAEKLMAALRQQEAIWKLSAFDTMYMLNALKNKDFIEKTAARIDKNRILLTKILKESGLFCKIFEGSANFLLAKLNQMNGYQLQQKLMAHKILIRVCDNFDFLDAYYVRFAVREAADILKLETSLGFT